MPKEYSETFEHPFEIKEFKPCAYYLEGMDDLTFITEDVSWRAENNPDQMIQVLWHPYEDRPVGFTIENPRAFLEKYIKEREMEKST